MKKEKIYVVRILKYLGHVFMVWQWHSLTQQIETTNSIFLD